MSAPVRPPLSVTDGTTTVRPTNGITFDSADGFTVTKNGTNARIDFTGGGSASLTDTYIGFGSASDLLTGSANFTFTEESGGNGPAVLLTGDKPVLKLQDDTAATDYRTEFLQSGASQYINSKDSGGTNNEMFRIDPTYIAMQRSMTAQVGIGTIPRSNVHLHVKGDATDAFLLLEGTDAGNNSAPDLVLFRNSATPADADFVGIVDFKGNDDGANEIHYGRIGCQIKDASTGTHDGSIFFVPARDGSVSVTNNALKLSGEDGAVFNENGLDNFDFRVESDAYQQMFFIDSGLNKAHFGTGGIDNALGLVQINVGNSTQNALTLTSTDADAASAPTMEFYRNSATPAAGDQLGIIEFSGENASGSKLLYASINAQIDSTTSAFSSMQFIVYQGGAARDNFRIRNSEVVVNEDSIDCNFRVEGVGTQNLISADAALNTVAINGVASSDADLTVHHTNASSTDATLRLTSTDGGSNDAPRFELYRNSASPADNDNLGEIVFSGENDAGSKVYRLASIRVDIPDVSAGSEDGWLQFGAMDDGTFIENMLTVRGDARQVVVNEDGNSTNFRVQGNSAAYLLFGNTTNEFVSIASAGAASGLADNEPKLQVEGSITSKCAIVTKTSATVDLSTRDSNELIGQLYVLTSTSAKTLTVPTTCTQGDWFRVLTTGANGMDIVASSGATLNGAVPATLTRDAQNEIYTVVAVATNKWICTSG